MATRHARLARLIAGVRYTVGEMLFLAELVGNIRAALLTAGPACAAEIKTLQARVEAAARDPRTVF